MQLVLYIDRGVGAQPLTSGEVQMWNQQLGHLSGQPTNAPDFSEALA